eukprot:scaffold1580_cov58-Phaeocystis_antarctica.AAC.1
MRRLTHIHTRQTHTTRQAQQDKHSKTSTTRQAQQDKHSKTSTTRQARPCLQAVMGSPLPGSPLMGCRIPVSGTQAGASSKSGVPLTPPPLNPG